MTPIAASGILLAGGRSRRMGRNKLDLVMEGETLLERTARIVSQVADEVVVAGLPPDHPTPSDVLRVSDVTDGAGPLAGLLVGLRAMSYDRAVVVACDLPHLQPPILRYLLDALDDSDAAVPVLNGFPQPVCAAYGRSALPAAEELFRASRFPLYALLNRLRVTWVHEDTLRRIEHGLRSLTDVDTPEEWESLHVIAAPKGPKTAL